MLSKSGRKPSMRACSYFSFELLPRCFIARPLFGGSRTHLNRCPSAQVNPRMWPYGDQINIFVGAKAIIPDITSGLPLNVCAVDKVTRPTGLGECLRVSV